MFTYAVKCLLCTVAVALSIKKQLTFFFMLQHWKVYKDISEIFILVPALLGLKGNLEMTLASRLSTAVSVAPLYTEQFTEAIH